MAEEKTGAPANEVFSENFENPDALKSNWKTTEAGVEITGKVTYEGKGALRLSKDQTTLRETVSAESQVFSVSAGTLEIQFAGRCDLDSMDNSYRGSLSIVFFNSEGKSLGIHDVRSWYKRNPWRLRVERLKVPDDAVSAQVLVKLHKETEGYFIVDALSIKLLKDDQPDDGLRRMLFTMPADGHLLFPEDPLTVTIEVWSLQELPESLTRIKVTVCDYWGGEQNIPILSRLEPKGLVQGRNYYRYQTTIDLQQLPLEVGRYYEVHGEILRQSADPFADYSTFAILPEAHANQFSPKEIPFTSRTWNQNTRESPILTHRLGVRICNAWGIYSTDPAQINAAQIYETNALGMGAMVRSPALSVERRQPGWEMLLANDGALMREEIRTFFAKYGDLKPLYVNLGNEPHNKGDDIDADIDAYRIAYTEIKKIDPDIFVVGSSMGPDEEYFKRGLGQWCDAYDFHTYSDPAELRRILTEKYPELFEKYGYKKPIWSTEIGLNSQGMSRISVASSVYKKIAIFFASGGANVSWFGLVYPDPEARLVGSFGEAHNTFFSHYKRYAPKLDAIAYYNVVNGIAAKRFVEEKSYDDYHLYLFEDEEDGSALIAYADSARNDIFLPYDGAGKVRLTHIDGRTYALEAQDGGVALTVGVDPVLITFEDRIGKLPEQLPNSPIRLGQYPGALKHDVRNIIEVVLPNEAAYQTVSIQAPPYWGIQSELAKTTQGEPCARISLEIATDSKVREASLQVLVQEKVGVLNGVLSLRLPVEAKLSLNLLPIPLGEQDSPGVKLLIRNAGSTSQKVHWKASINGEQILRGGEYTPILSTNAYFPLMDNTELTVLPHSSTELRLPIVDSLPATVYHVSASIRGVDGKSISVERPVAGFVPVERLTTDITLDGILDEDSWARAHVEALDEVSHFYAIENPGLAAPVWDGVDDLSAQIRYLWDDRYLYVAVTVKDDATGELKFGGRDLWRLDSLQMLIDPMRVNERKAGKYEYTLADGKKGAQVWCALSADTTVPVGLVDSVQLAIHRDSETSNDRTYEVAIPWERLTPFEPKVGGNLGFTLIVNEDDGEGRNAFMTWFGSAHNKDVVTVGDLILMP